MLIAKNKLGELRYTDGSSLGLDIGHWFVLTIHGQRLAFKTTELNEASALFNAAWLWALSLHKEAEGAKENDNQAGD